MTSVVVKGVDIGRVYFGIHDFVVGKADVSSVLRRQRGGGAKESSGMGSRFQ